MLREQKTIEDKRKNSQETKKGTSGGEKSRTPANPIPLRKVIHRINTLTKKFEKIKLARTNAGGMRSRTKRAEENRAN